MKRRKIPLGEQLAAALSMLLPQALRDEMRREKATAREVRELFQMDHNVLHSMGGSDLWWNLTPMLRELHREKSRGDTSIAAKSKRIIKENAAHAERKAAKAAGQPTPRRKRKIPGRPFPKIYRPISARRR